MSNLIKRIDVPAKVRKEAIMCPTVVNIYTDRVECQGGQGNVFFFKDYTGVDIVVASVFCAYAGVRFLNSVNAGNTPVNGANMLADNNRINFCSGTFSYAPANSFATEVFREIKQALVEYKKNENSAPASTIVQQTSAADELKKFKELLDSGVITQEEFNEKKKQLLGL